MARLLEVGYRMALMPSAGEGYRNEWDSLLQAAAARRPASRPKYRRESVQRERGELPVLRPREPVLASPPASSRRARERPDRADGADHRDVGRAERRLPGTARARADAAQRAAAAAALTEWTERQGALVRGAIETHAPAERRLRLPEPRLLPGARRQHRAPARREVLRAAARRPTMVGSGARHLPVDDAAARAVVATGPSTGPMAASTPPRKIAHFLILNRACPRSLHDLAPGQSTTISTGWRARYGRHTDAQSGRARAAGRAGRDARSSDIFDEGLHEFLDPLHPRGRGHRCAGAATTYLFGAMCMML